MVKFFLGLSFLILLVSCDENAKVTFKENNFYLSMEQAKLKDIKIEKWHVGTLRRQLVSKGVTVSVEFPELSHSDLDKLVTDFGINSWLIRVRKRAYSVNTTIGYAYIPLVTPGTQSTKKYRRHQIKLGTFSLYYPAAAISKRFEYFECPAFNHDRLIKSTEIETKSSKIDTIYSSVMDNVVVQAAVVEFNYSGNVFNAGESITGEYEIDLALYNFKNKERKSNFVVLNDIAIVGDEARVSLKGCEGFKIPTKEEDVDKMKIFRWKK